MISEDDYRKQKAEEIEAKLAAVEEVRPGDWITTIGSGHNQCTAVTAELIEGYKYEDTGEEVASPSVCKYRNEVKHCKRHAILRSVTLCPEDDAFPRDCPLEPTGVWAFPVCDCLPDYVFDDITDESNVPDHVPLLKFFETIKVDVRFLLDEARRLMEERDRLLALQRPRDEISRLRSAAEEFRSELENLVEQVETEGSEYLGLALVNARSLLEKTEAERERLLDLQGRLHAVKVGAKNRIIQEFRDKLEFLVEQVEMKVEIDATDYLALALVNARTLLEKTEPKSPPYGDCESSLGCRCVIADGKSKAVSDAHTCEACAIRDQSQVQGDGG